MAQCEKCKWFDALNLLYKSKFAYACTKCGWSGDFFDVDKHEAACTGESSKMYNCEFGCVRTIFLWFSSSMMMTFVILLCSLTMMFGMRLKEVVMTTSTCDVWSMP